MESTDAATSENESKENREVDTRLQKRKEDIASSKEMLEDLGPVVEYYDQLMKTPPAGFDFKLMKDQPRQFEIKRSVQAGGTGVEVWNKFAKPESKVNPKMKHLAGLYLVFLGQAQKFNEEDKVNFTKSRMLSSAEGERFMETSGYYFDKVFFEVYPFRDNKEDMEKREDLIFEMEEQVWKEFQKSTPPNTPTQ